MERKQKIALAILFILIIPIISNAIIVSAVNTSIQNSDNGTNRATGLNMPTPEEKEWMRQNVPIIADVRINTFALDRINQERAAIGEPLFSEAQGGAVPVGDELVYYNTISNGSTDLFQILPLSTGLPDNVDNSLLPAFPPIGDQDGLGSCTAWATTYYTFTYETNFARGRIASNGNTSYIFSPKWTYNMINGGVDGGSGFAQAFNLLLYHGAVTWAEFPYDSDCLQWCLNTNAWRDAINYRASNWSEISQSDKTTQILQMKTQLCNGHILVIGTCVFSWVVVNVANDSSTTADDPYVGQYIAAYCDDTGAGGHAMTIVGYNDNIWCDLNKNGIVDAGEKGAFKIANSWGNYWNDGFVWVSYDAVFSTSQVSAANGWPTTDRSPWGIFFGVFTLQVRGNYHPTVVAEFTINTLYRNQLAITLGVGGTTATSPTTLWYPGALSNQGGSYAFDGTINSCDGTFVFDFSDLAPSQAINQRWFLGVSDSTPGNVTTLKSYKLFVVTPTGDILVGNSMNVPIGVDNWQIYDWIDYAYEGHELDVDFNCPTILAPSNPIVLNATVCNRGPIDEQQVELRLIIDGSLAYNETVPYLAAGSNYTMHYTWNPPTNVVVNITVQTPVLQGEYDPEDNTKTCIVLVNAKSILIVNDNDGTSFLHGTSLFNFETALISLGYDYLVWNESTLGNPSLSMLTNFKLVIWTCGDYWSYAVDALDALSIQAYVESGGRLLLEGEDIGYTHDTDDFMLNVAHAAYQIDKTNSSGLTVTNPNHPVTDGLPSSFLWASEPPYDDGMVPANNGYGLLGYNGTNLTAVLAYEDSKSKVVYCAFPIYCLNSSEQETLSMNSINWLLSPSVQLTWKIETTICEEYLSTDEYNPSIATDANGWLYAAYEHYDNNSGFYEIWISKSIDGGLTWFKIGGVTDSHNLRCPSMAIDIGDNNNIFVVFEREWTTNDHDIHVLRHVNNSWSVVAIANVLGSDDRYPSITCEFQYGSSNRLYVSYEYVYTNDDRDLMFSKSLDDGSSWSTQKLHGDLLDWNVHSQSSITTTRGLSGNDMIYIVYKWGADYATTYDIVLDKSADRGNSWTQQWVCDESSRDKNWPSIAATHGGGTVVIAWHVYWDAGYLNDIQYTYSLDDGNLWNTGWIAWDYGVDERSPALTVDGKDSTSLYSYGKIHLAFWRDGNLYYTQADYSSPWLWTPKEKVTCIPTVSTKSSITTFRSPRGFCVPAIAFTSSNNISSDVCFVSRNCEISYPQLGAYDGATVWRSNENVTVKAGESSVQKIDGNAGAWGDFAIVFNSTAGFMNYSGASFNLYMSKDAFSEISAGDVIYAGSFSAADLYLTGLTQVNITNPILMGGQASFYLGTVSSTPILVGPVPFDITADYKYVKIYDGETYVAVAGIIEILPNLLITPPFMIDGNLEFTLENGVVSGNGTKADPFLIKDWEINASATHGIVIRNTDAYFMIENCTIYDGGSYCGIFLNNVTNGRIENCTVYNNYYGIYVYNSTRNTLTNNTVSNNLYDGINLYFSSNNTITDNLINNTNPGIKLYYSSNNSLTDNTLKLSCLIVQFSYNNTVTGNTVNGFPLIYAERASNQIIGTPSKAGQVVLVNCTEISVKDLQISNTGAEIGIEVWESYNVGIFNITCSNNFYGILLIVSSGNVVANNTCYNNSVGIGILSSANTTITNCNFFNNSIYGAYNFDSNPLFITNATNCWWGSSDGPSGAGSGTGDGVSYNVLYAPWLVEPYPELHQLFLVVRGQTNIFYRMFNLSSIMWDPWLSLNGLTTDAPATALFHGKMYVAVRGTINDQIWVTSVNLTSGVQDSWTLLDGATPSAPALVSDNNNLILIVRGNTNIFYRFYNTTSSSWDPWLSLNGLTADAPAATIFQGKIVVAVRGTSNDQVWVTSVNITTGAQDSWTLLDGAIPSAPALASDGSQNLVLLVRGNTNIFYRFYNTTSFAWDSWQSLQGLTPDAPAAAICNGKLYNAVRGMNNDQIWVRAVDIGGMIPDTWQLLDGSTPSAPALASGHLCSERLKISNMYSAFDIGTNSWNVTFSVINTGCFDTTITNVLVNDMPLSNFSPPIHLAWINGTDRSLPQSLATGTQDTFMLIIYTYSGFTNGQTIEVKVVTSSASYSKSVVLP